MKVDEKDKTVNAVVMILVRRVKNVQTTGMYAFVGFGVV